MPTLTICVAPGCGRTFTPDPGQHGKRNRCPQHQQERDAQDNARKHAQQEATGRNTSHWRRVRKARLDLDGHRCCICGQPAATVHLHPALRSEHRLADLANTCSLCLQCHSRISGGQVPAIAIRLALEAAPEIVCDWDDASESRLFDWLDSNPELLELLGKAFEIADRAGVA